MSYLCHKLSSVNIMTENFIKTIISSLRLQPVKGQGSQLLQNHMILINENEFWFLIISHEQRSIILDF